MDMLIGFLVLLGVAAWLSSRANNSAPGRKARKALRKLDSGGGKRSRAKGEQNAEGNTLSISVEHSHGGYDSYEKTEREASKRAFNRVVPENLDEYTREQLAGAWMRDRRGHSDLVSDFEIILAGKDWQWPWLEKSRQEFQEEDARPGMAYVARVYQGLPQPPQDHRELADAVKVAEIRNWLKEHNRYPSPAPKKRAEFDALLFDQPWNDLQPWAEEIFEAQKETLLKRYEHDRVALLVGTLKHAKWQEAQFIGDLAFDPETTFHVSPDSNVIAAREAIAFNHRHARPLPPYYPGDTSRLERADPDNRRRFKRRLSDAAVKPGEDPSVYKERVARASWRNAKEAAYEADFDTARGYWLKAANALGRDPSSEDLRSEFLHHACTEIVSDPAYIIVVHRIRQRLASGSPLLQSEVHDMIESQGEIDISKAETGLLVFLACKRGDLRREKAGRSFSLLAPD